MGHAVFVDRTKEKRRRSNDLPPPWPEQRESAPRHLLGALREGIPSVAAGTEKRPGVPAAHIISAANNVRDTIREEVNACRGILIRG